MKITREFLQEKEACDDQRELLDRVFPNGAEFNKRNWNRALKAGLDVFWLARNMLREEDYLVYRDRVQPAWSRFQEDTCRANTLAAHLRAEKKRDKVRAAILFEFLSKMK